MKQGVVPQAAEHASFAAGPVCLAWPMTVENSEL